jgi:hypothetical protein
MLRNLLLDVGVILALVGVALAFSALAPTDPVVRPRGIPVTQVRQLPMKGSPATQANPDLGR